MENEKNGFERQGDANSADIKKKSRIKSALAEVITYGLVFGWIPPVSVYLVWDKIDIITSILIIFLFYLFWWKMWRPDWVELLEAIKDNNKDK